MTESCRNCGADAPIGVDLDRGWHCRKCGLLNIAAITIMCAVFLMVGFQIGVRW